MMKNNAHIIPNAAGSNVMKLPCELAIKSVESGVIASLTADSRALATAHAQKNIKLIIKKNNAANGNLIFFHTPMTRLSPAFKRLIVPITRTNKGIAYISIIMRVLLSEAGINPLKKGIPIS